MRQVNLVFDPADLEQVNSMLHAEGCNNNVVELAIGYLSTWNFNYPIVDIHLNTKNAELTAVYLKGAGYIPTYVIGAVFDKKLKTYGFHS